jgi:hypothetical protein
MDGRAELKYCAPALISQRVLEVARAHLAPDVLALGRASVSHRCIWIIRN